MINKNFWRGKKVLITGHTGFKGGWLSLWLKKLGAKVYGYSLNPISKKCFFNETKLKAIFESELRKNVQDFDSIQNFIKVCKPEIIFHLAAQPQVLESFNNPFDTIKTNIMGTANILEITRNQNYIKCLLVITTDKVYKNLEKNIKFKEDSCLGGDDVYSSSKASADILTQSYLKSFYSKNNCNVASARAGNCIGGGDWTKYRILTDSTESFLKGKKLKIRNPGHKRPWQHVLEPLSGYILLAQKLCEKKGKRYTGAWNFGPKRKSYLTVLNFTKIFRKKLNSNSKIFIKKDKEKREKNTLDLNSNKANTLLKWNSFLSINETLSLTAEWYLSYRNKEDMLKISSEQIDKFQKKFNQQ